MRWLGGHPRLRRRWPATSTAHVAGGLMLVVVAGRGARDGAGRRAALFDMVRRQRGFARWDRAVAELGQPAHATDRSDRRAGRGFTNLGGTARTCAIIAAGHRRRTTTCAGATSTSRCSCSLAARRRSRLVNNVPEAGRRSRERPDVTTSSAPPGSSFPSGHSAAAAAALVRVRARARRRSSPRRRAIAAAAARR